MNRRHAKGRRDSDNCHIVGRTVNFNLEDPLQKAMYEATLEWTNFSGRIKRLLEAEVMDRSAKRVIDPTNMEQTRLPETKRYQQEDDFDPVTSLFGRPAM